MDSRLRQPGWGRKQSGIFDSRESSLPPILDRGGRGAEWGEDRPGSLLPRPGPGRGAQRAASLGAGVREEGRRGQGGEGGQGREDHSLPPLARSGAGGGSTRDHSLPPLHRSGSGALAAEPRRPPEAAWRGESAEETGRAAITGRQSGSRSRRPVEAAPAAAAEASAGVGAAGGRPPRGGRSESRGRRAETAAAAAALAAEAEACTPPPRAQRPPAAPRGPLGTPPAAPTAGREAQPRQTSTSRKSSEVARRAPSPRAASPKAPQHCSEEPVHPPPPQPRGTRRAGGGGGSRGARASEPVGPPPAAVRSDSPPIQAAKAVAPAPMQLVEKAMAEAEAEDAQLLPCPHCGRKFKAEAHAKHVNICVKVFQQKRKVFNVVDQRLPDAPELVEVRKDAARQARKGIVGISKEVEAPKSAWRQKSEAFRAAMKDAQVVKKFQKEGRPMSELPPPRSTDPMLDDRTPCPHCGRRFGAEQAARHIPLCKNTKAKPAPPPRTRQPAPALPKKAAKQGKR